MKFVPITLILTVLRVLFSFFLGLCHSQKARGVEQWLPPKYSIVYISSFSKHLPYLFLYPKIFCRIMDGFELCCCIKAIKKLKGMKHPGNAGSLQ